MIALGNFSDKMRKVKMNIDWEEFAMDPEKCEFIAPLIKGFQPYKRFDIDEEIIVPAKQGWLLLCR